MNYSGKAFGRGRWVYFFSPFLTEQEDYKYRQFKAQNEIASDAKKVFCPLCDSYATIEENSLQIMGNNGQR